MDVNFFLLHRKIRGSRILILWALYLRGFINIFTRGATGFHRWEKLLEPTDFPCKKDFPLDNQIGWTKSFSQPINLPSSQPSVKPLISSSKNKGGSPCTRRTCILDLNPRSFQLDYSFFQYRFHVYLKCKICLFAFCFHVWCNHTMHYCCSPQCLLQAVFEKIKILLQYSMYFFVCGYAVSIYLIIWDQCWLSTDSSIQQTRHAC